MALFGWDLIYKISEQDLVKKDDVLTLFVHYALIKEGYKCIGLGDDKTLTGNEVRSETLPANWNTFPNYSIRYVLDNNLYILKGLPVMENTIVYNLLVTIPSYRPPPTVRKDFQFDFWKYFSFNGGPDMRVTNVAFNSDTTVAALRGELDAVIPTNEEVIKKVNKELIAPMGNGNTKEATTQATASASDSRSQRSRILQSGQAGMIILPPDVVTGMNPHRPYDPERDPLRIGQRDLDPLGVGGGGMIFNPFGRSPNPNDPSGGLGIPPLPRGSVPPGARFDPFGPVLPRSGPRPRMPPGSDDFPPPGFGGDMFM